MLNKLIKIILGALVITGPFLILNINSNYSLDSQEKILEFNSIIKVNIDSSLDITETIKVLATGNQIKRGIVREFPLNYRDNFNNKYNIIFELISVTKDHKAEKYKAEYKNNGIYIYIGNPKIYLEPGIYTYQIKYKTKRQLGFFKDFDELYWNVTGNGWRLPIEFAQAEIILPDNIPADKIKFDGYTGKFSSKEKDYKALKNQKTNTIYFKTIKPLEKYAGLTIAISWPKDYVKEPSLLQKFIWLLKDNLNILIILLGLILVIILGLFWIINFRKTQQYKTIIPLFEPPQDLSPAAVRYIYNQRFDSAVFTSMVVDMAVKGYLKISKPENSDYQLKKEKDSKDIQEYNPAFKRLFIASDSITLSQNNSVIVSQAVETLSSQLTRSYSYKYFDFNIEKVTTLWLVSIVCTVASVLIDFNSFSYLPLVLLIFLITFIFSKQLSGYTSAGIDIMEKIEGFKLFLSVTESERLKIVGTPPDKNPELYEKYLPYAIALDVEKQWSKQFAPIFQKLKQDGQEYQPTWFIGPYYGPYNYFDANRFSSDISNSLSTQISNISSSDSSPGSSSGSGGSGSSGGGSGGGGGGGW